ncbi:MAG: DUF2793 domain-containing protein [Janthinobacterium lividum]
MAQKTGVNLGLAYGWNARDTGQLDGLNLSLRMLDLLVNTRIDVLGALAPPTPATNGYRCIVAPVPDATQAFNGNGNNLAVFEDNAWLFYTPSSGGATPRVYVSAEKAFYFWDGSSWTAETNANPGYTITADTVKSLQDSVATAVKNAGDALSGAVADLTKTMNAADTDAAARLVVLENTVKAQETLLAALQVLSGQIDTLHSNVSALTALGSKTTVISYDDTTIKAQLGDMSARMKTLADTASSAATAAATAEASATTAAASKAVVYDDTDLKQQIDTLSTRIAAVTTAAATATATAASAVTTVTEDPALEILPLRQVVTFQAPVSNQMLMKPRLHDADLDYMNGYLMITFARTPKSPTYLVRAATITTAPAKADFGVMVIGADQTATLLGAQMVAALKTASGKNVTAIGTTQLASTDISQISLGEARPGGTMVGLTTMAGVASGSEDSGYLSLKDAAAGGAGTRQAVNPFLNDSGQFDFGFYLTRFKLVSPDVVVLSLDNQGTDSGFNAALTTVLSGIRKSLPNAIIILATHYEPTSWPNVGAQIVFDLDGVVQGMKDAKVSVFAGHAVVNRFEAFIDVSQSSGQAVKVTDSNNYTKDGAALYGGSLASHVLAVLASNT